MKKKHVKVLLGVSTLLSLSVIPVSGITTISTINSSNSTNSVNLVNTSTQAITINTITMNLNKDYKDLDWYGKNFSSSVTEQELKQLITPSIQYDVNWGVNILTPTDTALSNGYVEFTVYQINNTINDGVTTAPSGGTAGTTADGRTNIAAPSSINYTDGSSSNINMQAYPNDTSTMIINGQTVQKSYVWTTKNISGLFLPYKYNFEWNTNEEIGDFLQSTTATTLTAQDIYSNMISTSKITDILPDDTVNTAISFSQQDTNLRTYGISGTDATTYGVGLVTIDFSKSTQGNNATNWSSNSVPNEKYLVRGLVGTNGSKEQMHLSTDGSTQAFLGTTFNVSAIKKQNPNFKVPSSVADPAATTVKVSDFTPTELANALVASSDGTSNLLELLTTKTYLDTTSTLPALYLTYMGKSMFDTSTATTGTTSYQWNGTGLYQMGNIPTSKNGVIDTTNTANPANDSKITAISATTDDSTGTLNLKVTYNKYNVFQNVLEMGDTTSIVITGLKTDDSESSGNTDLYFQWKSVDELIFSSASDVLDLYNNNKTNSVFLKSLSNSFFEGSENTYQLDRTVEISVSNNVLSITITFPNFGNAYYTDASGQIQRGLQEVNQYTFTNISSSTAGITFKSQDSVNAAIASALGTSDISTVTPKDVIDALSSGKLSLNDFYTANGGYTYLGLVTQNDTSDGLVVEVSATTGNNTYKFATFYNGFSQGVSSSYIYNFAFSDNSDATLQDGLAKLKAIPIDKITVDDIFNDYVSNLPIYSGTNKISLTVNDIQINKDTANNSITVTIIIPLFDSSNPSVSDADRTFSTTLNGFLTVDQTNNNTNAKILNLTIPLSVSFALLIVIIMVGLLTHLIIKRKKLAKSKISLRSPKK